MQLVVLLAPGIQLRPEALLLAAVLCDKSLQLRLSRLFVAGVVVVGLLQLRELFLEPLFLGGMFVDRIGDLGFRFAMQRIVASAVLGNLLVQSGALSGVLVLEILHRHLRLRAVLGMLVVRGTRFGQLLLQLLSLKTVLIDLGLAGKVDMPLTTTICPNPKILSQNVDKTSNDQRKKMESVISINMLRNVPQREMKKRSRCDYAIRQPRDGGENGHQKLTEQDEVQAALNVEINAAKKKFPTPLSFLRIHIMIRP